MVKIKQKIKNQSKELQNLAEQINSQETTLKVCKIYLKNIEKNVKLLSNAENPQSEIDFIEGLFEDYERLRNQDYSVLDDSAKSVVDSFIIPQTPLLQEPQILKEEKTSPKVVRKKLNLFSEYTEDSNVKNLTKNILSKYRIDASQSPKQGYVSFKGSLLQRNQDLHSHKSDFIKEFKKDIEIQSRDRQRKLFKPQTKTSIQSNNTVVLRQLRGEVNELLNSMNLKN